ncbi:MAG: FMN-binding protein [Bilophila wadsworthia]
MDAVSGATISSTGVVTALGNAAKVYAALKPEIVKAWQ